MYFSSNHMKQPYANYEVDCSKKCQPTGRHVLFHFFNTLYTEPERYLFSAPIQTPLEIDRIIFSDRAPQD